MARKTMESAGGILDRKPRTAADAVAVARGAAPSSRKKGHVKRTYMLKPYQAAALQEEAFQRARERGAGRADESEVLRGILDAWLAPALKGKTPAS